MRLRNLLKIERETFSRIRDILQITFGDQSVNNFPLQHIHSTREFVPGNKRGMVKVLAVGQDYKERRALLRSLISRILVESLISSCLTFVLFSPFLSLVFSPLSLRS